MEETSGLTAGRGAKAAALNIGTRLKPAMGRRQHYPHRHSEAAPKNPPAKPMREAHNRASGWCDEMSGGVSIGGAGKCFARDVVTAIRPGGKNDGLVGGVVGWVAL